MKKIFVIEDDPGLAREFQKTLRSEGFAVSIVSDGEASLHSIDEMKPDVLLLDLQLPGLRVTEWIRRLRSEKTREAIPIVALGNSYDRKTVDEAWKAGIKGCIYKSTLTPRALLASVYHALGPNPEVLQRAKGIPMPKTSIVTETRTAAPVMKDLAFRESLRNTFLGEIPETVMELRSLLLAMNKANKADRLENIAELRKKARFMTSNAALSEVRNIANLTAAFEAFLKELHDKPDEITVSTLRTIALTTDFIAILARNPDAAAADWSVSANVLSVDDEPLSRRAVSQALQRANLKCVSLESPELTLNLLKENDFDLLVLDILMPQMDGFELCKRLRALPRHKKTPVIFVTSLGDFESKAKSTLAGGNDLIAKPFLFMELAVKALIHMHKGQLKN